jgi:hypothetical protein
MNNNDFNWIIVEDIIPILAISPNTDISVIKPHIVQAQTFDSKKLIGTDLYAALNSAIKANIQQWKSGRTYNSGDKVFYNNAYYIANTTTTEQPPNADYDDYELMNFYYQYFKKWLAVASVVRYIPFMGLHATQWGLEQYTQEGFGQVSDKRRSELTNSYKNIMSVYENEVIQALTDSKYIFDGVQYENKCIPKKSKLAFTIIGAGQTNNYEHDSNRYSV